MAMVVNNQEQSPNDAKFENQATHWTVIRDVIVFQFKLALDGFRDLMFSPISIGAAIIGMIVNPKDPGRLFSDFLEWGHKTDRWINLFGAAVHYDNERSSDTYIREVEGMIKREYDKRIGPGDN